MCTLGTVQLWTATHSGDEGNRDCRACASCADSCDSATLGNTGTHGDAAQHTAGTVLATRVAARGDYGITCQRGDACQAHVAPDAFFRSIDPHFEFFDAMVLDPS
eukprot:NODE_27090_length_526_cov_2.937343.p3 GENE.NODE_27090_length_526_cov_2.937343~~NODE_27090_length_526_cov_2.937343.p3  ORF type:complete len:105 (+),score=17.81 NODE_27090_length_526_cov_2.937343:170-484(+)